MKFALKLFEIDEGLELDDNSEEDEAENDDLRACIDPLCGWSSKLATAAG